MLSSRESMIFPNNLGAAGDEPSLGKKKSAFWLLCPFCSIPSLYTLSRDSQVRRNKIEGKAEEIPCTTEKTLCNSESQGDPESIMCRLKFPSPFISITSSWLFSFPLHLMDLTRTYSFPHPLFILPGVILYLRWCSYLTMTFHEFVQRTSFSWNLQGHLRALVLECNSGSQEFVGTISVSDTNH